MLQMEYEPEGFAENVADGLGIVTRRIEKDLERFRDFIEIQGTETGAWRSRSSTTPHSLSRQAREPASHRVEPPRPPSRVAQAVAFTPNACFQQMANPIRSDTITRLYESNLM